MGNKSLGLLLMIFTYFYVSAASSPTQKKLLSDTLKDTEPGDRNIQPHEHGTRDDNGENYTTSGIAHGGKIAHGGAAGAHGGRSAGSSEHGSNGGSGSPHTQGSTAIIPIIAGGAASNRHPNTQHGASSCNRNCAGHLAFILIAIASLAHLYMGWQN